MIVEGYSMDLYCDSKKDHFCRMGEADFSGDNRTEVRELARKRGWIINDKERTCYCPVHAKPKDR